MATRETVDTVAGAVRVGSPASASGAPASTSGAGCAGCATGTSGFGEAGCRYRQRAASVRSGVVGRPVHVEPRQVHLPDGRVLTVDDTRDPGGTSVLYLHGTPDSRLARHPDDGLTAST